VPGIPSPTETLPGASGERLTDRGEARER
jgi:hypothetical protein